MFLSRLGGFCPLHAVSVAMPPAGAVGQLNVTERDIDAQVRRRFYACDVCIRVPYAACADTQLPRTIEIDCCELEGCVSETRSKSHGDAR
jgi:hypothetical protein